MNDLDYVKVDHGEIVDRHLVLVDEHFRPLTPPSTLRDRVVVGACLVGIVAMIGFLVWAGWS